MTDRPGTGPERRCFIRNCESSVQHYYLQDRGAGVGLEQRCRYHFQIVAVNMRKRGTRDPDVLEITASEAAVWRIMNE